MDMIADRLWESRERTFVESRDGQTLMQTTGDRPPRRRDAGQRRELPDQEALHRRPGDGLHQQPGSNMTQLHRARSGHELRTRRGDHGAQGSPERRRDPDHGLEHGRESPGRLPVGRWRPRRRELTSFTSIRASAGPRRWPTSGSRSAPDRTSSSSAALIRYVLENELYFREYVVHYTNAPIIIREDFKDTEELGGVFSGFDEDTRSYDPDELALRRRRRPGTRRRASATGSGGHAQQGANVTPDLNHVPRRTRRSSIPAASSRS